jgi:phasin family protein
MQAGGTEQPFRQEHDMSNKMKSTNAVETNTAATADITAKALERTFAGLTDGMARATAGVEQTRAKLQEGTAQAVKKTEEMVKFGQGNIEALTKSSQIWAAGVQDLSKQVAASFQASIQASVGVLKTLGTVKSIKEAIDLQSGFARTALEKAMSESGRLSQASLKLTEQALAPLTTRVNSAVETFGKIA